MQKTNISEKVRQGLEAWAGEAGSSEFLTFYLKLLAIQTEVEGEQGLPGNISPRYFEEHLLSGSPLLVLGEIKLDKAAVNKTFHRIAELFAEYPKILGPVPPVLLSPEYILPVEAAKGWFVGKDVPQEIDGQPVNPLLMTELVRQTLRPFLIKYSQGTADRYGKEGWRRNYCPVCGSEADFSYLEKEAGGRFLVCPACSAEWQYQRMQCPYCGNTDAKTLSYYTDEAGLYRLYLCEKCKSYLKAIDLRKTTEKKVPALESLTTIHLDRQAQEMGYHRGGTQAEKPA